MDEHSPSAQTSLFDEDAEEAEDAEAAEGPEDAAGSRSTPSAGTPARGRSTFALGRTDRRTTELRMIDDAASPISGPFRVKAVVRDGELADPADPIEG